MSSSVYVSISKAALLQVKTKEQEHYIAQTLLLSALYFRPDKEPKP